MSTFVAAQPLELLHVSVVTLAEIRFGIERLSDLARRSELNDWFAHKVRPMFTLELPGVPGDSSHGSFAAVSKSSGLTPPMWL